MTEEEKKKSIVIAERREKNNLTSDDLAKVRRLREPVYFMRCIAVRVWVINTSGQKQERQWHRREWTREKERERERENDAERVMLKQKQDNILF